MPHTVYVEKADHWQVIGDYSGSPRHSSLTEEAWKREFGTNEAYALMRKTHPDAIAGVTPKGVGCWTKDWANKLTGKNCCK